MMRAAANAGEGDDAEHDPDAGGRRHQRHAVAARLGADIDEASQAQPGAA